MRFLTCTYRSWKTASLAIADDERYTERKGSIIELFFSSQDVLKLLSRPSKAFSEPTAQSKKTFETKTSAINITPSSSAPYSIAEIKEDALWLSQKTQIDEISALRVVLVECQSWAATQLLGRLSSEEIASIKEVSGNSNTSSPLSLAITTGATADGAEADFDSQESRQLRILRTYLSERRYLFRSAETAMCQYRIRPGQDQVIKGKGPATPLSWVESVGEDVAEDFKDDAYFLSCMSDLAGNVEKLHNGSGWYAEGNTPTELQADWEVTQIMEMTHMMGIMFHAVDSPNCIMPSILVLEWLRLAAATNFFSDLPPVSFLLEYFLLRIHLHY